MLLKFFVEDNRSKPGGRNKGKEVPGGTGHQKQEIIGSITLSESF
jgi:hypothetical protein